MTSQPFTSCKYGIDAEGTHEFEGVENFNESMYFNFLDPVSRLGGLMRIGNRPGLGYSEATVQLTLPNGAIALRAGRAPSQTNDAFSSQGLEFTITEPTRSATMTYRNTVARVAEPSLLAERGRIALKNAPSDECELDLTFEASSPMFVTDTGDGSGTPGSSTISTDHYEQFGHISGTVRMGNRTWVLDRATAFRDHSWGPREWASYTGEWLAGWLADGTGFSAYGEFDQPSGVRKSSGAVVTPDGQVHTITEYTVYTDYAGEATYDGRHVSVVQAEGLPMMILDGSVRHVVPVTQRTADRGVRMAQMTVDFAKGHGGWAIAEFLRPL